MSPKSKRKTTTDAPKSITDTFSRRDGLGAYIDKPESFPPSRVIYFNDDFVVINDLYPKSSVHLLLLPRDPSKTRLHPFDAFEDITFLIKVQDEVRKIQKLTANELRRLYGKYSRQDKSREEAMEADPPPDQLPAGRDWNKEIVSGIHAHPSMNDLHIHILSVDRFSDCLRHRKHYNSFSTPFFVPMSNFPLDRDDVRRHPGREGYLKRDFRCWKCGKDFGNKFSRLKDHLAEEFEDWKKI